MFASSYDTNPNQMHHNFQGKSPKKWPATCEPRKKKKLLLSNESWLGIRDPYDGLLIYPHITGKDFIPNKSPRTTRGRFFIVHLPSVWSYNSGTLSISTFRVDPQGVLNGGHLWWLSPRLFLNLGNWFVIWFEIPNRLESLSFKWFSTWVVSTPIPKRCSSNWIIFPK